MRSTSALSSVGNIWWRRVSTSTLVSLAMRSPLPAGKGIRRRRAAPVAARHATAIGLTCAFHPRCPDSAPERIRMKDRPPPPLAFARLDLGVWRPAAPAREPAVAPQPAQAPASGSEGGIRVSWARHLDEVRAAQRLRNAVFACEMGARLTT